MNASFIARGKEPTGVMAICPPSVLRPGPLTARAAGPTPQPEWLQGLASARAVPVGQTCVWLPPWPAYNQPQQLGCTLRLKDARPLHHRTRLGCQDPTDGQGCKGVFWKTLHSKLPRLTASVRTLPVGRKVELPMAMGHETCVGCADLSGGTPCEP